jgi:hypothetical protein
MRFLRSPARPAPSSAAAPVPASAVSSDASDPSSTLGRRRGDFRCGKTCISFLAALSFAPHRFALHTCFATDARIPAATFASHGAQCRHQGTESHAAHVAEQQALTQQLLSTQLSVCQLQAQMLTLAQQSFFVQSKLNSALNQHGNLMHSLQQMALQASQLQSQPGGVPPQLQQQMHSMRTSLAQLQSQSQLLQGQKVQIQHSVQTLQVSNGAQQSVGSATGTAAGAAAAGSAGLVAQQNRVAQLQNQVQVASHQHMQRMSDGEVTNPPAAPDALHSTNSVASSDDRGRHCRAVLIRHRHSG